MFFNVSVADLSILSYIGGGMKRKVEGGWKEIDSLPPLTH